jgi:cytochrome P450
VEGGDELLDTWLSERPAGEFFDRGRDALADLLADRRGLGGAFPPDTLHAVLEACHDVAAVSGGMFGLRDPITPEEDAALQRVATSFDLGSWRDELAAIQASVEPSPPRGPPGHLFVGSVPEFTKNPLDFICGIFRDYGEVVRVEFGPVTNYFVFHPDGIKHVLMDNHRNYRLVQNIAVLKEFLGDGMFTTEGETWRKHRRLAQPAFHMQELASMADAMTRTAADDIAHWLPAGGRSVPVDLMARFMQLTLRIAGVTLFGMDLAGDATTVGRSASIALEFINQRIQSVIRLPLGLPTEANRRFLEARAALDHIVYKLIAERRSGKQAEHRDLLQMLLDARDDETKTGLDDKELRDELLTMLGAGHETTALALMWTCYFISKYPPVRRALDEEIESVLEGRTPALSDLPRMPLVKKVIEESVRLRPPFWLGGREAIAEDEIGGVTIPPGAQVLFGIYATHRHPGFWRNPEGFDPERFSDEAARIRHPLAFVPFGAGPKKCIGLNFAMMEMQLVLPMVLKAFDFWLLPGVEPEPAPGLTLRARDGVWVTLHPR